MYKTHHHFRLPYNYANFGIFSPFGREKLIYDVDVLFDEKGNTKISHLFKQHLQHYSKPTLLNENDS